MNDMWQKRYGSFRFEDYAMIWTGLAIMIVISLTNMLLKTSFFLACFPVILSALVILSVISRYTERFLIQGSKILALCVGEMREIALPDELTLVISDADICLLGSVRTPLNKGSVILRGKYAVSILDGISFEDVTERLSALKIQSPTMSQINEVFSHEHIYSCVCNNEVIGNIADGRNCLIIVQNSLLSQITIVQGENFCPKQKNNHFHVFSTRE